MQATQYAADNYYIDLDQPTSEIAEKNAHACHFLAERKQSVSEEKKTEISKFKMLLSGLKAFFEKILDFVDSILYLFFNGYCKPKEEKRVVEGDDNKKKAIWSEAKKHMEEGKIYRAEKIFETLLNDRMSHRTVRGVKTYLGTPTLFKMLQDCAKSSEKSRFSVNYNKESLSIEFCFNGVKFHQASMAESINQIHIDGLNLVKNYPDFLIKTQSMKVGPIDRNKVGADELLEYMPYFFASYGDLTNFLLSCGVNNQQTGIRVLDIMTAEDKSSQRAYNLTNLFAHFMVQYPTKNDGRLSGCLNAEDMTASFG